MKVDVPMSIPEGVEFPEYKDKTQLGRWIWRHIQIPQLLFLVTTLKRDGIPNCEVNSWGLPFGFVPDQMFAFVCGRSHHTGQNVLRDGEFVINVPGADIGGKAERAASSYPDDVDEITKAGLTAIPAVAVRPPRIMECRAHFECRLEWFKEVDKEGGILFCGRVVAASGDREVLVGDVESKIKALRPIFMMPWNIDTEKMELTGGRGRTTGYADVGVIRYTADG
jgi:flavin reductase (DIM6/NTAB) family NADH-FMN oxidoreductase RutF